MRDSVCWIDTVEESAADETLAAIYDRVRGKSGQLDNLYQGFSLRPHTILAADALYLAAMHRDDNTLPKRFSELLGTYVAILTGCTYAETHHGHNFAHLNGDQQDTAAIMQALRDDNLTACGTTQEVAALRYAKKLCLQPETITRDDVAAMRKAGWSDGEVLEVVQVVAMFSYFVRVINGVGIQLSDEKPGLY